VQGLHPEPSRIASLLAALFVLGALVQAPARAAPGLLVGATDDAFLWYPERAAEVAHELGLTAFRVSLQWAPGQTEPTSADTATLDDTLADAAGLRVVVTVYGKATAAPRDDAARTAYCEYVRAVLARYPSIDDVVIWNEANLGFYWQPQFGPDGTSAAPGAYEALLARCWDVLHSLRPGVNVIMTTSPSGNDNPNAASNVSHSPAAFIRKMGAAYRASGRTAPIFDTVGHNPYGMSSAEPPWQQHLTPSHIGEGDLDRLVQALRDGFGGTAQPVPGRCVAAGRSCLSIWYLEAGYQTAPEAAHRSSYSGRENDAQPVPDGPAGTGGIPSQSEQLADGLRLAYCQPYVGAFFNFLLWDEPDLARWQSGVLWADGARKASFDAFRQTIAEVASGSVDCSRPPGSEATGRLPAANALVSRVEWPSTTTFSRFNEVWRFAIDVRVDAAFRAILYRAGSVARKPLLEVRGLLARERPRVLAFPEARVPPGVYRIGVEVRRRNRPQAAVTLASAPFTVR
jgi:hypothetical protein